MREQTAHLIRMRNSLSAGWPNLFVRGLRPLKEDKK